MEFDPPMKGRHPALSPWRIFFDPKAWKLWRLSSLDQEYMDLYLKEFDWRYNARKLPDMERTVIALQMVGGKRLMLKSEN